MDIHYGSRTTKSKSRKKFIFSTFLLSSISVILLSIALATQDWMNGQFYSGAPSGARDKISYGLFRGKHEPGNNLFSNNTLYMTCIYNLNVCAYSCRPNEKLRKEELTYYREGKYVKPACDSTLNLDTSIEPDPDTIWFNIHVYISTILFLSLSIFSAALAAMFGIYNINRNPIQPIFGILGLYIWNGCSAGFSFMVLMLWGIHYGVKVTQNFSYIYTMFADGFSDFESTPGYSYWLILVSMVLHIISSLLLIDRSTETTTTIPIQKADDTIFIY